MNRVVSRLSIFAFALAVLSTIVLLAGGAVGQAISGNLTGTVVDSSGAAVTTAEVQMLNLATGVSTDAKANSTGDTVSITCPLVSTGSR